MEFCVVVSNLFETDIDSDYILFNEMNTLTPNSFRSRNLVICYFSE